VSGYEFSHYGLISAAESLGCESGGRKRIYLMEDTCDWAAGITSDWPNWLRGGRNMAARRNHRATSILLCGY
jgi:hypothetical protein